MNNQVGHRLRQVREALSVTQKSMSLKLGFGASTWQKIERGENLPSGETLLKIAELGFNPGWILTGEGPMSLNKGTTLGTNQEYNNLPGFSENPQQSLPSSKRLQEVDVELLIRVYDAIFRTYTELNVSISIRSLADISVEKHNEIIAVSDNPADWPAMVSYMTVQLRKEM